MHHLRRGMTFLELVVVLLIVGLLAAIGTPHFASSVRTRNVRNASIQIADYVNYVRNVAINEGRSTTLTVLADGDQFSSPDVDFPDRIGTPISLSVKDQFDSSLELNASFDTETTLTFDFEGAPHVARAPLGNGVISIACRDICYEVRIGSGPNAVTIVDVSRQGVALEKDAVDHGETVAVETVPVEQGI